MLVDVCVHSTKGCSPVPVATRVQLACLSLSVRLCLCAFTCMIEFMLHAIHECGCSSRTSTGAGAEVAAQNALATAVGPAAEVATANEAMIVLFRGRSIGRRDGPRDTSVLQLRPRLTLLCLSKGFQVASQPPLLWSRGRAQRCVAAAVAVPHVRPFLGGSAVYEVTSASNDRRDDTEQWTMPGAVLPRAWSRPVHGCSVCESRARGREHGPCEPVSMARRCFCCRSVRDCELSARTGIVYRHAYRHTFVLLLKSHSCADGEADLYCICLTAVYSGRKGANSNPSQG